MTEVVTADKLTDQEIEERVRILKRLRETLLAQRSQFRSYLSLLEQEETAIADENLVKLEVHVKMEQTIISEITALQKVIVPLEELYAKTYPYRDMSVAKLETSLSSLKKQVLNSFSGGKGML